MALKWTNTSPPSSLSIKPNPFFSLNHFTLPSAKVTPSFLNVFKSGHHFAENKKTTPALDAIYQPVVVIPFTMQNVDSQLLPIPPSKIHCACNSERKHRRLQFGHNITLSYKQVFF